MKRLLILSLLLIAPTTFAAIEKYARTSETGVVFQWWPKVAPPHGWHHDDGSSRYFAFNAFAPDGSTFSTAETVLYAKASYRPRVPEIASLAAFVSKDIAQLRSSEPGISITPEPGMRARSGLRFKVVRFEPGTAGTGAWERVAYAEDGEYFLTFAVSSHSAAGLKASASAFRALLDGYTPGP
ncbi:hypothetical protein PAGU2638_28720 [Lysobacter sp. PAGU 2638]